MSESVFAYGSNMCSGRFRVYGVTPEGEGRAALLTGYRLRFNKKSQKDGSGKANVEPQEGGRAWGVLYTIPETDLQLLDEGEKGYSRVKLPVLANNVAVDAWVYIASSPDNDPALRPYSWYKRFLVEGAREHAIPPEYVAELEQIDAAHEKNEKRDREKSAIACRAQSNAGGPVVVILVHWLIKTGMEEKFTARWKQMTIGKESGLYREILTKIDVRPSNPKFHTFSVGDPFYSTFINIGMWESVEAFDRAVGKYIPEAEVVHKDGR
jgi:gamma-glutamylcyclotransferase